MATNVGTVSAELTLDTRKASQQYRRLSQEMGRANRNVNGLGSITQDARKFESALGAATNRVTAFAAAAVVFNTVKDAVSAFARSVVEVDKSLAQINVNLGQSADGLKKFGADLFGIARQTGQTFEVAAKAAEELARQGLGAVETTKRLKDALILSRIAGISSADAVETLTAAINSFNQSALTSTEVVNKFAAVDTRFAVSSKDLAEAISRVGSTAQSAGVGIDELIGLVTSLQQTTARGGATIGNGLKTIFTRIQAAPETISALQSLGVSIKYSNGELRSAVDILRDYAKARESVGEAERASLDRTIAGTFQVNILKAAIGDLSSTYSTYDSALRTSNNAVDEAIIKNAQLNQTLSALLNSTAVSIKQVFAGIGEQSLDPILRQLLGGFEKIRGYLSGDTGSQIGKSLGEGILSGITNILTGPVFFGLAAILGKAFYKIGSTIKQEAQALLSINNTSATRAKIQERINFLLANATQEEYAAFRAGNSILAQKQAILAIQQRIAAMEVTGTPLVNSLMTKHPIFRTVSARSLAPGVPNMADPIASAVARESKVSGLPVSQIYVGKDTRVANFANPAGLLVANRRDEPSGAFQGVNRVLAMGGNPKVNGIPNFAPPFSSGSLRTAAGQFAPVSEFNVLFGELRKVKPLSNDFHRLGSEIQDLSKNLSKVSQTGVIRKLSEEFNLAYIRSKVVDDNSRRAGYTPPSGVGERIDQSRGVMDRNKRNRFLSSGPAMFGPAYPINPQLQAKLEARDQTIRWANAGISPGTEFESPIGPPTRENYRKQRLAVAVRRGQRNRNTALATAEKRRQSNSNRALYGGLAASFAGGFIPEGDGGTTSGILYGAAGGAAVGAGIGGIAGPAGLAAGATIGALIGALGKVSKSADELAREFSGAAAERAQENDAIARVTSLRSQREEAIQRGDPASVIEKLTNQLVETSNLVTSESGRAVLAARTPEERDKLSEQKRLQDSRQNTFGAVTSKLMARDTSGLSSLFGSGLNSSFVKGIDNKKLSNLFGRVRGLDTDLIAQEGVTGQFSEEGRAEVEKFNALMKEATPIIGDFVDVTKVDTNNIKNVMGAFVSAILRFKDTIAKENRKGIVSKGLPNNALLSPLNQDVFKQAGAGASNRYLPVAKRARAQFDFFNELAQSDSTSQAVIETNPAFKQSRALTQRQNILESTMTYLQGRSDLNINTGMLSNNNGELNGPAIQKLLERLSKLNTKDSDQFKLLADIISRAEAGVAESGYKQVPSSINGLVPGTKYSTYAPEGRQDPRIRVNPYGMTNDYSDKAKDRQNAQTYFKSFSPAIDTNAPLGANSVHINLDAMKEAEDRANGIIQAANQIVIRTALQVDGTVRVTSDTLGGAALQELAAELTATIGKKFEAQVSEVNNKVSLLSERVSAVDGKRVPPKAQALVQGLVKNNPFGPAQ
jgi:TP901 family phage tail tape measure protein